MAERRALERLLTKDLSGKEIARLTLLAHTEELAGREPTFSEAEIERAKAALRGRPHEIAVYNAWIEALRIVDFVSLEAIANAAEAEKCLSIAIGWTAQLLRHGTIRAAREIATKVLTPDQWVRFPAEREMARRDRMAEQSVSLNAVIQYRIWQTASEDLRAKARTLPEFEEDENEYDCLLAVDRGAALRLRKLAEEEIAGLVASGKLRFSRQGKDVSRLIGAATNGSLAVGQGEEEFGSEAECSLLELVEAGLPEWVDWSQTETFTPSEFRGPIAVLQEIPPECLDEAGKFVEPGWQLVEKALRREASSEKLDQLRSIADACASAIRVFLARMAVIEVFGQGLDLDLCAPPVRKREQALHDFIALYNRLAEISQEAEPDEDGFVPADWMLPLPRALRLPVLDLDELKPDANEIQRMRDRLATPDEAEWRQVAEELAVIGAMGDIDAELRQRVRQRGRELGSLNRAIDELARGGLSIHESVRR
jgi:hypothetical protein